MTMSLVLKVVLTLTLTLSVLAHISLKQERTFCNNVIPGLDKMLSSVDISQMDLFPIKGIFVGGTKTPIIQKTCLKGKSWRNSVGIEYQLPTQVEEVITTPGGSKSATVDVYRSYQQVKSNMAVSVGLSVKVWGFAFSSSTSYKKMQNSISSSNKEILDTSIKEYSHAIYMKPPTTEGFFRDDFLTALNELKNKTYASDKQVFKKFILDYGTHYITQAEQGGMIRKYIEISSSYSYKRTDAQLKLQAHASYKGLINSISANFKYSKSETYVDEQFKKSSTENVKYYGGEANLVDTKGLTYWQATVDKDPILLKVRVKPLYEVTKDPEINRELKIAIDQYLTRAFLGEMERKLSVASRKYGSRLLNDFTDTLKRLKRADILNLVLVNALNARMEYHLEIPQWFSHDTQLCMKYGAHSNGNAQCNDRDGTDKESLCALTNNYTPTYHDNTGTPGADGGCYLQWGIQTVNAPDWFYTVKIWVNWHSNVNDPKGRYGYFSEYVGKFTQAVEDNSYRTVSKNRLRWMITAPSSSPLWFKNTKLCFKYWAYAHQCHTASGSKNVCAKPGRWTEYFYDQTNSNTNIGCKLNWGWMLNGN